MNSKMNSRLLTGKHYLKKKNCDESFTAFYKTIDKLLDEMAPFRRLTKKEINLLTRPWIKNGILKSIKDRDHTNRNYLKGNNEDKRKEIYQAYKGKRNLIKILIRQSKRDEVLSMISKLNPSKACAIACQ